MPSFRGSSQPKDWTQVSHIACGFFTVWTPRKVQEHWNGLSCPHSGCLPNSGVEPRSPTLQADSLPAEPQGKSKNTGVGSRSLLQGIFPTQGLNPGLPHCRRILYQLSHQGSPRILECVVYPFSRRIFPTQESNQGLLHCRRILYQLSYQGSPRILGEESKVLKKPLTGH